MAYDFLCSLARFIIIIFLVDFTGDMMTNSVHKLNTFILSNMVPQYPIHNNYPWNDWEEYVRQRAREERSLYVITGVAGVLLVNHDKSTCVHDSLLL